MGSELPFVSFQRFHLDHWTPCEWGTSLQFLLLVHPMGVAPDLRADLGSNRVEGLTKLRFDGSSC
jgi:hypothetical protein